MAILPEDVLGLSAEDHRNHHNRIHDRTNERYDIRDYGASTNLADNGGAIQSAIDAAALVNSYAYIPEGVFKTTTTIKMKADNSALIGVGTIDYRGNSYALNFGKEDSVAGTNYRNMLLQGIKFVGTSSALGAIRSYAATRSVIDKIKISGFTNGYGIAYDEYGWINSILQVDIQTCDIALKITTQSLTPGVSQPGNALTIIGGELGAGCRIGMLIGAENETVASDPIIGINIALYGVTFEGADNWGFVGIEGYNIILNGCYFEANGTNNGGHVQLGNSNNMTPVSCNIQDCTFLGSIGTNGFGIYVYNCDWLTIRHNQLLFNGDNCTGIKYLLGDFVKIEDNFIGLSVDTPYDFPTTGNYILQKMGGGIGESIYSGTHGWDWQAQTSYIHRYKNTSGATVAEMALTGDFDVKSIILKSPNNTRYKLVVDNSGNLTTTPA